MQWVFDCVWMGHEDNPHHPIAVPTMHFQLCCWGSSQCSKGGRAWQKAAQMETMLWESDRDPRAGVQRGSSQGDLSGTRAACEFGCCQEFDWWKPDISVKYLPDFCFRRTYGDLRTTEPCNVFLILCSISNRLWWLMSPGTCDKLTA